MLFIVLLLESFKIPGINEDMIIFTVLLLESLSDEMNILLKGKKKVTN